MQPIISIGDAKMAIALAVGGLPLETREPILKAVSDPSPVVMIVDSLEALYAMGAKTDEVRALILNLAEFVIPNGWHGINEDNRGARIVLAMRRDLGQIAPEGTSWPEPETDPAPKSGPPSTPATPPVAPPAPPALPPAEA